MHRTPGRVVAVVGPTAAGKSDLGIWLAIALGLVPSERTAMMNGRAKFSEAIAIYGSTFVERGDFESLQSALQLIVARSGGDVLSATVKQSDGKVLIEAGDRGDLQFGHAAGRQQLRDGDDEDAAERAIACRGEAKRPSRRSPARTRCRANGWCDVHDAP